MIVEDDYDAEYRYDREPIASLQGSRRTASPTSERRARPWRLACGWGGFWSQATWWARWRRSTEWCELRQAC